ncbi:MAG: hypothetical protein AAFQ43_07295 [Bacteroidota bacterium]
MRLAIQVVLAIAIVVLAYFVFQAIRAPWAEYQERLEQEAIGRERMRDVRAALVSHRDAYDAYPSTLDSLVTYVKTDTMWTEPELDEDEVRFQPFDADALTLSARNGEPLNFELVTTDTSNVVIYWLQDPAAPEDSIGSRQLPPNPAQRNATSWNE